MNLRGPHKRMKMGWRAGFFHRLVVLPLPHPDPSGGTSPRATFSHSAFDHRSTIRHVSPAESRDGGRIPDRRPGHAFVRMTACGLRTIEMALVC